jgi:hypothetical protein
MTHDSGGSTGSPGSPGGGTPPPTEGDPCWLIFKATVDVSFRKAAWYDLTADIYVKCSGTWLAKCQCESNWEASDGAAEETGENGDATGTVEDGAKGTQPTITVKWIKKKKVSLCVPATYETSATCGGKLGGSFGFEFDIDADDLDGMDTSDGDCSKLCDTDFDGTIDDDVSWGGIGAGAGVGLILDWALVMGIPVFTTIGGLIGGDSGSEADCFEECMEDRIKAALDNPDNAKRIYDSIIGDIANMVGAELAGRMGGPESGGEVECAE